MADAEALKKAFESLDSLEKQAAQLEPKSREGMLAEVRMLRTFASGVHARSTGSAGESAAEVEQRLNAAKGKFMCGACHGHGMGMMHRGEMGNQGPPQ